jgi:hypothetical protein
LLEAPESSGLGTFTTGKQVAEYAMKTMWMLTAEAGLKWDISDQFSLYTGLCIDYSLNGINRSKGKPFLVYNPSKPSEYFINSVLNTQYTENGITRSFLTRTNPVSAGIVIRLAFKLTD